MKNNSPTPQELRALAELLYEQTGKVYNMAQLLKIYEKICDRT